MGGGGADCGVRQGELGCRRGGAPGVPTGACRRDTSPAACSHAEHFGLREVGFGNDTKRGAGGRVGGRRAARMQVEGKRWSGRTGSERRRQGCPVLQSLVRASSSPNL